MLATYSYHIPVAWGTRGSGHEIVNENNYLDGTGREIVDNNNYFYGSGYELINNNSYSYGSGHEFVDNNRYSYGSGHEFVDNNNDSYGSGRVLALGGFAKIANSHFRCDPSLFWLWAALQR